MFYISILTYEKNKIEYFQKSIIGGAHMVGNSVCSDCMVPFNILMFCLMLHITKQYGHAQ